MSEPVESPSDYELHLREAHAADYDAEYLIQHGKWFPLVEVEVLRNLLRLDYSDTLLDLGCGTGRLTLKLAPFCSRVIAVDRSSASLCVLNDRLSTLGVRNVTVHEADATHPLDLPARPTKAVASQLLQHLPSRDKRRAALKVVFDALTSNGLAVFVDEVDGFLRRTRGRPKEISQPGALYFHSFAKAELQRDLAFVGYSSIRAVGVGFFYWTRYRAIPRSLGILDVSLSSMPIPINPWFAKFIAVSGIKR